MLHETDLEAAVADGIVTSEQAATLRVFAEKRARERAVAIGHEERFQFMRSFNDFFFAIGVALFGGGLIFFTFAVPLYSLISAVIIWALSELLVARMRLVLPGILLVCFFVVFALLASPIDLWFGVSAPDSIGTDMLREWFTSVRTGALAPHPNVTVPMVMTAYALAGAVFALLFYVRFRLPFALLLVAGGLVSAVIATTHLYWPGSAKAFEPFVLLACGIAVFAAAMAFDASDRERLTRRADCAFWLHLLAAPIIVHSLIQLVWLRGPQPINTANLTTELAIAIALIIAVLAVIAIITDRRALLVSALTYLGIVIGYAITGTFGQQGTDKSVVFFATLLALGALVVALGVGWQPLRRVFLSMLPPALTNRLPPVTHALAAEASKA